MTKSLTMIRFVGFFMFTTTFVSASLGCFSQVDTSAFQGFEQYGTQLSCSQSCGSDFPYVAIKNGGVCYCLAALPNSLLAASSSQCSVPCNGYGAEICGGTNAYTVFDNTVYVSPGDSSFGHQLRSRVSRSSVTSPAGASEGITSGPSVSPIGPDKDSVTYMATTSSAPYKTDTAASGRSSLSPVSPDGKSKGSNNKSTNVGPIVGGVVGGLAAVAIVVAVVIFLIRRSNLRDDDDEEDFYNKGPSNSTCLGSVARAQSKKINSVFDMPMANPFEHPSDDLAEKRASKVLNGLSDPRLNPVMMGRRRLSESSLADETDYSRKILGVANP